MTAPRPPETGTGAAASKLRASSHCHHNGPGAGTPSRCQTRRSSRITKSGRCQLANPDPIGYGATEGISQLYLSGRGDRSYFDIRAIQYVGFSESDIQSQLPVIHPVLDYSKTLGAPVFGGEFGYSVNLTSLVARQRGIRPDQQPGHTQLDNAAPRLPTPR